jgi:hypothetical protein
MAIPINASLAVSADEISPPPEQRQALRRSRKGPASAACHGADALGYPAITSDLYGSGTQPVKCLKIDGLLEISQAFDQIAKALQNRHYRLGVPDSMPEGNRGHHTDKSPGNGLFMELAGLEPATSWVRSRRSPN